MCKKIMEKGVCTVCVSVCRETAVEQESEGAKSRKRELPEVLWHGLYMKTLIAPGLLLKERWSERREQRKGISVL